MRNSYESCTKPCYQLQYLGVAARFSLQIASASPAALAIAISPRPDNYRWLWAFRSILSAKRLNRSE